MEMDIRKSELRQYKSIYIVMLPISTNYDNVSNLIHKDTSLHESIIEYYNNNLSSEEIFKEDNNLIITESGFYFALFEDSLNKK